MFEESFPISMLPATLTSTVKKHQQNVFDGFDSSFSPSKHFTKHQEKRIKYRGKQNCCPCHKPKGLLPSTTGKNKNVQVHRCNGRNNCLNSKAQPQMRMKSAELQVAEVKLLLSGNIAESQKQVKGKKRAVHQHSQSSNNLYQPSGCNQSSLNRYNSESLLHDMLQTCVRKQELLMNKKLFDPHRYFSKRSEQGFEQPSRSGNQLSRVALVEQADISVAMSARIHRRQLESMFKSESEDDTLNNSKEKHSANDSKSKSQIKETSNFISDPKTVKNEYCSRILSKSIQQLKDAEMKINLKSSQESEDKDLDQEQTCNFIFKNSQKQSHSFNKDQSQTVQDKCSLKLQSNQMSLNSTMKTAIGTAKKSTSNSSEKSQQLTNHRLQSVRHSPQRCVKQSKEIYYKIKVNQLNHMQKMRLKLKITRKK